MICPLAPVQQTMLRARGGGRGVEQFVLDLRGADRRQVERAWRQVVESVEGLRLRFVIEDGEVVGLEPGDGDERVLAATIDEAWLEADRAADFDWSMPPWRAAFDDGSLRFCWTLHHALFDGASMARVMRAFFDALHGREVAPLGWPTWVNADEATCARAAAMWRDWFGGCGKIRLPQREKEGGLARREDKDGLSAALAAAAGRWQVTPATLITWAWAQALIRWGDVDRIAVGQVRRGSPLAGTAGFSMNTLPLMATRAGTRSVAVELAELRARMLDLRQIENVAVERVESGVFGTAEEPWSSILMVESATPTAQLTGTAGAMLAHAVIHERTEGTLTASAWLQPELVMEVEANDPFGRCQAGILLDHWWEIVRRLADGNEGAAVDFTGFPAEWESRLAAWETGGPAASEGGDLGLAWQESLVNHRDLPAIVLNDQVWTYHETGMRVARLARALHQAGVRRGDRVGACFEDRRFHPIALLAAARLGAIHLPLDLKVPTDRLRGIVQHAGASVVVSDLERHAQTFERPWVAVEGVDGGPPPVDGKGGTLILLYTSGSTGTPKGVPVGHAGVINECVALAGIVGMKPGSRIPQFSSPGFDASVEEIVSTLLSGATLVVHDGSISENFEHFGALVLRHEVDILDLPTAFFAAWCGWMRDQRRKLPAAVRAVVIGGERLSSAALRDWRAIGGGDATLVNTYGPTETSIIATYQIVDGDWPEDTDPLIGRPLPGYLVRVMDDRGEPRAPGVWGELWIGGQGVNPGYWDAPELSERAFVERDDIRWFRSGDRVRWNLEGGLEFGGRFDDQLKIRGHRIEPGEVVRLLEGCPQVSASVVAAWETPGGTRLAAWLQKAGPEDFDAGALRDHLAGLLPVASIPSHWCVMDEFPLTERGKVDRRSLPAPQPLSAAESRPPATATGRAVAEIWSDLLGVEEISGNDDFFDLGGNSLLALRLFSRLTDRFGIRLPLSSLMGARRLDELAALIDRSEGCGSVYEPPITSLGPSNPHARLFCVHGGDGGVLFYRELAEHLPEGISLSTMESPELGASGPVAVESVEELAERYLISLRRSQPHGPYYLAGYSFGGVMVYQMAARLLEEGEKVGFLGLFDTANPAVHMRKYRIHERISIFWKSQEGIPLGHRLAMLVGRAFEGVGTHIRVKMEIAAVKRNEVAPPHSKLRMLQIREAHSVAMDRYRPPAIPIPLVLFKTEAVDDKFEMASDYGWNELVESLEVIEVPGNHDTMFESNHILKLASSLGEQLPEVAAPFEVVPSQESV